VSDKTLSIKNILPSDYVGKSSAISLFSNLDLLCSKSDNLKSAFNEWENALLSQYTEEYLNQSSYSGAYFLTYGKKLMLDFNLGFNYISPENGFEGGYVVYIPENYDGTPVGLSLIYHDSGIRAGANNQEVAKLLESGDYVSNKIIVIPRASGQDGGEGSFSSEATQAWILELVNGIENEYNVDKNDVSLTSSSSGERGAMTTVLNNPEYFLELNLIGVIGKYDYTKKEGTTSFNAVDAVKSMSDSGITVNLYCGYEKLKLYEDDQNVNVIMNSGDHATRIAKTYSDSDFLNSIGVIKNINSEVDIDG